MPIVEDEVKQQKDGNIQLRGGGQRDIAKVFGGREEGVGADRSPSRVDHEATINNGVFGPKEREIIKWRERQQRHPASRNH